MRGLVLGSGATGLLAGAALVERGHELTSVDRGPGEATDGTRRRRGVMRFEQAPGFRPQLAEMLQRRWPAAYDAVRAGVRRPHLGRVSDVERGSGLMLGT